MHKIIIDVPDYCYERWRSLLNHYSCSELDLFMNLVRMRKIEVDLALERSKTLVFDGKQNKEVL